MKRIKLHLLQDESGQPLLLIVLALLALSAGAGIWLVSGKFLTDDTAYQETRDALTKVSTAICSTNIVVNEKEASSKRSYCQDVGTYPLSLSSGATTNLLTKTSESTCSPSTTTGSLTGWCGPYWSEQPITAGRQFVDGWGTALVYNTGAQTLTSYGPNRVSGGADDITVKIDENIVTKNLILYYDAAKYNGTTFGGTGIAFTSWYDLTASMNTGSLTNFNGTASSGWNGTGTTADPYRLTFDSTNDYVTVSDAGFFKPQTFTTCLWINRTGDSTTTCGGAPTTLNYFLFKRNSRTSNFEGYSMYATPTLFGVYACDKDPSCGFAHTGTATSNGNWYHICATYDRANFKIYQNGALDGTGAYTKDLDYGTRHLFIGRTGECGGAGEGNWDAYFNGSIATVMIYNRALSASEISQNCKAQKGRFSGVTCS